MSNETLFYSWLLLSLFIIIVGSLALHYATRKGIKYAKKKVAPDSIDKVENHYKKLLEEAILNDNRDAIKMYRGQLLVIKQIKEMEK